MTDIACEDRGSIMIPHYVRNSRRHYVVLIKLALDLLRFPSLCLMKMQIDSLIQNDAVFVRIETHFNFHKSVDHCALSMARSRDWNCRSPKGERASLHLPPLNFFHNTAMTVQYLINLMKYIS